MTPVRLMNYLTALAVSLSFAAILACLIGLPLIFSAINNTWEELDVEMALFAESYNDLWKEMTVMQPSREKRNVAKEYLLQDIPTADEDDQIQPGGLKKNRNYRIFTQPGHNAQHNDSVIVDETPVLYILDDELHRLAECACNPMNHCPAGPVGPPGEPGIDGYNGEPGVDGPDGYSSSGRSLSGDDSACFHCPNGPMGPPGARGRPGPRGMKGAPGTEGMNGRNGAAGSPGEMGPVGPTGLDGRPGPAGAPGKEAEHVVGVRGNKGESGPMGPTGAPGDNGRDGTDGQPGKVGIAGLDGLQGAQGQQGPVGDDGDDGKPDNDNYCGCPVSASGRHKTTTLNPSSLVPGPVPSKGGFPITLTSPSPSKSEKPAASASSAVTQSTAVAGETTTFRESVNNSVVIIFAHTPTTSSTAKSPPSSSPPSSASSPGRRIPRPPTAVYPGFIGSLTPELTATAPITTTAGGGEGGEEGEEEDGTDNGEFKPEPQHPVMPLPHSAQVPLGPGEAFVISQPSGPNGGHQTPPSAPVHLSQFVAVTIVDEAPTTTAAAASRQRYIQSIALTVEPFNSNNRRPRPRPPPYLQFQKRQPHRQRVVSPVGGGSNQLADTAAAIVGG